VAGVPDLPVRLEDVHDFVGMLAEQKGLERTSRFLDFPASVRAREIGDCQLKPKVDATYSLSTGSRPR
jgi:hypothetical protein